MEYKESQKTGHEVGKGYELTDAKIKPLFIWMGIFFGTLVFVALFVRVFFTVRPEIAYHEGPGIQNQYREPGPVADMPTPKTQAYPGAELVTYNAEEASILDNYAWIDREHGVLQIPIERAIDLVAQKGLPYRNGKR